MAFFHFGKKKEETGSACCCSGGKANPTSCCDQTECDSTSCCGEIKPITSIKVLGAGCKSCHAMLESAKTAVSRMGLSVTVEYITDMETIMSYGVMLMPALVVNEKVVSSGQVLNASEIETLLRG